MILLMFAAVLGFLWYLADRHLKERFMGYLKYGSLVLIGLFVFTDVYMSMEKGNLIAAHECCESCDGNDTTACEQCCISYTSPSYCEVMNLSAAPPPDSGDETSLPYRDGNEIVVPLDMQGTPYDIYVNYSCPDGYSLYMFKGMSDVDDNTVGIWNGTGYQTFYTYGSSAYYYTQEIDMSGLQYQFANTTLTGIRLTSTDYAETGEHFRLDQSILIGAMTTKMYCDATIDTGTIMAWHYIEYWVMHDWIGVVPYVMIFLTMVLIIQAVRMWYDGTYGK